MAEPSDNLRCQCHLIDWSGGPGNYRLLSTGEKLKYSGSSGHCCQTKVNEGFMSQTDYLKICRHELPIHVVNMMIADRIGVPVSSLESLPHNQIICALNGNKG